MSLIDITNWGDHPTEPGWLVFRYGDVDRALAMRRALEAEGIPHEVDEEGPPWLIGVRKKYRERAELLNYRALGGDRPRFIADRALRWLVLGLVGAVLLLALAGMLLG